MGPREGAPGLLDGLCPFIIIINSAGRYSVMKEIINYSRRVMSDERINLNYERLNQNYFEREFVMGNLLFISRRR